jgi:type I restriction enzyme, S subunit
MSAAETSEVLGPLPPDWRIRRIEEIASVGSGGTPSRKNPAYWGGTIPWVTTAQIEFGTITEANEHITEAGLRGSAARVLAPDTLLLALYGQGKTRGKVAKLGIPAATNQACASIVPSSHVDGDYLFHFLASRYLALRGASNAGSQENLSGRIVKEALVALPPKAEQGAIATALSDVDALLTKLDQLIAKKRDLKQAAMQQLLTGRLRLQSFTEQWEVRNLASLGSLLKGRGVTRDQANTGSIACVRYGEIYTTHHDIVRGFTSWISPAVAATATRLKDGDILFAGSGETKEEIGKCVAFIDDFEAYAGGDIVILRPRGADSRFLGYALNTPEVNRQKANFGQGDAVVHISAAALGSVTVRLPPLDEQVAIGTVLADMDAELAALESRREKTRHLKQGMMQALLTGRIRLV